jgi:hypothetical protein
MGVPEGTLTDEYRARPLEFYGRMLGWREMESLRLPDRLTVAVGSSSISASESGPTAWCLTVTSTLASLSARRRSSSEPLSTNDKGEGSFRFRYLLPMAVEVQFYAELSERASSG